MIRRGNWLTNQGLISYASLEVIKMSSPVPIVKMLTTQNEIISVLTPALLIFQPISLLYFLASHFFQR